MLKKTITYTDYNNVERTEDFYFNLTPAELTEMEFASDMPMTAVIDKISKSQNVPETIKIFKDLILKAYGEKSPDGRRFIKSDELSTAFSQTEAYNELFMECGTDAEAGAAFLNGIMPNEAMEKIAKKMSLVD